MNIIEARDIQPRMFVRIIEVVSGNALGFAGCCFKVLAVDYPYAAVEMIGYIVNSKYSIDLREFRFAVPSDEYVAAIAPDEVWPEVVG
jgi:hypothetical protein